MRLLADENMHPVVVTRLREAGHDVEWVRDTSPGAQDTDILRRSDIGSLTLVTNDRDFGDLVFNRGYPVPDAILYSRVNRARPHVVADRLIALIEGGSLSGRITTLVQDGVRTKPFPTGVEHG